MKRFGIFLILSVLIFSSACTKVPEKFNSPTVKIDLAIEENQEVYILQFSASINNENNDIALTNFKGTVQIIEAESNSGFLANILYKLAIRKNKIILELPFDLPVILPFESAVLDIEKKLSENEITPILNLLEINKDDLIKNKSVDGKYFDKKNVNLNITDYEKENIIKLLKGKLNEKN